MYDRSTGPGSCPAAGREIRTGSARGGSDADIEALTEDLSGEDVEETASVTPPPLSAATVARVTTASLHHPDQDDFAPMDTGYRVLDGGRVR